MVPKVDWGQATEVAFEPLPNDTYDCRLAAWSNEGVGPSGFEYYNLEFTVDDGEFVNRKLWDTFSISPKALFAFKRALIAMGANPEDVGPESDKDVEDVLEELVGAPCRLVVKQRSYTDKDSGETTIQNDVKKVLPPAFSMV